MVPSNLATKIKIGQEVKIPLRNKVVRGIIFDVKDQKRSESPYNLKKILEIVDVQPTLNEKQIKLAKWLADYYCTSLGLTIKLFLPKRIKQKRKYKKENHKIYPTQFPLLTSEQNKVFQKIIHSPPNQVVLLHGITGSGKTEIYLAVARHILEKKKQVAILIPEIALTPQTISRFLSRFPKENIAVLHSRLSSTEKFTNWQGIRENKIKIIIGPRSIVFAPYQDLGLIVVDEEHDSSYKSYDQTPRYHARDVAVKLGEMFSAKVILGSATPSFESYWNAKKGKYLLLELHHRFYTKAKLPKIEVVDMREETKKKNFSLFSEKLQEELKNVYQQNRQAILFLNRRGTSTFVLCQDCGYVAKCKKCDVPMVCHTKLKPKSKNIYLQKLICHHCSAEENIPLTCPHCASPKIKLYGAGTEKVEIEIQKLLPKAKIRRLDSDIANKKFVHSKLYFDFLKQKYNILVGTQMIAKGWDIPGVDLVGIVLADTILNLPDFRSAERTFQLILQVAGRTGRKENPGKVILQTYQPENPIISAAASYDFKSFYEKEDISRKELDYPPYSQLIKIIFRHKNKQKAFQKISNLASKLQKEILNHKLNITILGPAPAFIPKVRNYYIWQIILKSKIFDVKLRNHLLHFIPPGFLVDIDPESLL